MLSISPSSSRSVQEKYEDDDRWLRTRRRHRVLSGICTILALMIVGAAWYAYPILKRHDSSLAQLVHTQQALDKINGSLQLQRSKVAEWSKDQEHLRDQAGNGGPYRRGKQGDGAGWGEPDPHGADANRASDGRDKEPGCGAGVVA